MSSSQKSGDIDFDSMIILFTSTFQAEAAYKLALEYLDKAKKLDKDKKLKLQKEILQVGSKKIF